MDNVAVQEAMNEQTYEGIAYHYPSVTVFEFNADPCRPAPSMPDHRLRCLLEQPIPGSRPGFVAIRCG
jgi:hypothetical protein